MPVLFQSKASNASHFFEIYYHWFAIRKMTQSQNVPQEYSQMHYVITSYINIYYTVYMIYSNDVMHLCYYQNLHLHLHVYKGPVSPLQCNKHEVDNRSIMGASPLVCLSCHFLRFSDFCDPFFISTLLQTDISDIWRKTSSPLQIFFIIAFTAHIIDCLSQWLFAQLC